MIRSSLFCLQVQRWNAIVNAAAMYLSCRPRKLKQTSRVYSTNLFLVHTEAIQQTCALRSVQPLCTLSGFINIYDESLNYSPSAAENVSVRLNILVSRNVLWCSRKQFKKNKQRG